MFAFRSSADFRRRGVTNILSSLKLFEGSIIDFRRPIDVGSAAKREGLGGELPMEGEIGGEGRRVVIEEIAADLSVDSVFAEVFRE